MGYEPLSPYVLSFDGVNDYVQGSDSALPSGSAARTIECWISGTSLNRLGFGYGAGFAARNFEALISGETLGVGIGGANIFYTASGINDDNWHHIAIALPSTGSTLNDLLFYMDGEQLTTVDSRYFSSTVLDTRLERFSIGRNIAGSVYYEQAEGEVRIWDYERTQAEIQYYMNLQLHGNEAGLVAYYPFTEGVGTTLTDATGNGNHGTINGATWMEK
jgi:hypothetical protein